MKKIIFNSTLLTLFAINCIAQNTVTYSLQYKGFSLDVTKNKSFINRSLKFLNRNDTTVINQKIPFNYKRNILNYSGLYYNCHLKEDSIYTITLKKICPCDIPKEYHNYYSINIVSSKNDCSKFQEVVKNTKYKYWGNYEKYVDVNGVLYEVIELNPKGDCFLPH